METIQTSIIKDQLEIRKEKLSEAVSQMPDNSGLIELIKQVDSTLEKLNNGTYGACEVCHDSVEAERLLIDPLISVCLGCLNESQQRALENDLEFAAKIQWNLLPKNHQSIGGVDFSYYYNPAGPVSGDFIDIIPLKDNSTIFIIGDVSGKGISASLMMSHLHGLMHSLLSFGLPVNEIVEKANRLFCESVLSSNYATMVMGKVYPDGNIEICVAGHNPPLYIKNGEIQTVGATGVPVGLFCESQYGIKKFQLDKGDSLLLYTDGLTESSINNIEYGENRVKENLLKANGNHIKTFIDNLISDHTNYLNKTKPSDDLTVLGIRRG